MHIEKLRNCYYLSNGQANEGDTRAYRMAEQKRPPGKAPQRN
jgi:hypothetical protein